MIPIGNSTVVIGTSDFEHLFADKGDLRRKKRWKIRVGVGRKQEEKISPEEIDTVKENERKIDGR